MLGRFLTRLFKNEERLTGRWKNNDNRLIKELLANMDNCGHKISGCPYQYSKKIEAATIIKKCNL